MLSNLGAQRRGLETVDSLGVERLIKEVFIKGSCRNVENITGIGDESLGLGQFYNGGNSIGLEDGIIISTGSIELARGPNNNNGSSFELGDFTNDLDLRRLATDSLFDVTGIEFDFIPFGNRVSFKYVFASEEYCEFVGTDFNDVFGFFVSGPGIDGPFENNAINIANLDGTDVTVAINNVNHLQNSEFYVNNVTNIDAEACDVGFSSEFQNLIEYDGFTVPLIASFEVVPCETYRIRLVLGDVGDDRLDSAVFLESKSFDLGEKVAVRVEVPGTNDIIAYEGCVDGQFVFTRNLSSNINEDCVVDFDISSLSTASNGIDFEEITTSITIPSGDREVTLPISVFADNVNEERESLFLELFYRCDCIDPVLSEFIIDESIGFSTTFDELKACIGEPFSISPVIDGGAAPFTYLWETGSDSSVLVGLINQATNYELTITDFCGNTDVSLANIGLQSKPTALLSGVYDYCRTKIEGIPVQLGGVPPWSLSYTIDGRPQERIDNIQSSPFFLPTLEVGTYEITSFDDSNCTGVATGNAVVDFLTFDVDAEVVHPTCFNSGDGSIRILNVDAIAPFNVSWDFAPISDVLFLDNLEEGRYTISISDANSCVYIKTFVLDGQTDEITDCVPLFIPNSFSPNRDGINDYFSVYADDPTGIAIVGSLKIYDLWGNQLFEQNNFQPDNGLTGWDGNFRDAPVNIGVYVYKIVIVFEDRRELVLSGDVTLLR